MGYTAGEAAKRLGLSKDCLRYYEKEGLLPSIGRDPSGRRLYSESDIEWIFLIRCLRETDMPIGKIKQYVVLLMEGGGNSIPERRDILAEHRAFLAERIAAFQNLLGLIEKKLEFYDEVLGSCDPESVRCMDYAAEWEHFRSILGGITHE